MRRQRDRLLKISKDHELTAYVPKPELILVADERTEGMVSYYRESVRNADWKQDLDYLERLARSCYLQGAQDAANVAAQLMAAPPSSESTTPDGGKWR